MCKCPVEVMFDDNEFLGFEDSDYFASDRELSEKTSFSAYPDVEHQVPVLVTSEHTRCPECSRDNYRIADIKLK